MRIISEFKDYYDAIQAYGVDPSIVYVRETTNKIEKKTVYNSFSSDIYNMGEMYLIGFCGKLYPMIRAANGNSYELTKTIYSYMFSLSDVDKYVSEHKDKNFQDYFYDRNNKRNRYIYNLVRKTDVAKWFDQDFREFNKIFSEKIPVFSVCFNYYRETFFEYNPCLKDLGFYRVVQPYNAYQELSAFISSFAKAEKPMPVIPDDLKAESKGFDAFSFRKGAGVGPKRKFRK